MENPYDTYPVAFRDSQDAILIVPSDTVDLPFPVRLWNTASGTVTVTTVSGRKVTLPAGYGVWPVLVTRVWATGTTATNMVGIA